MRIGLQKRLSFFGFSAMALVCFFLNPPSIPISFAALTDTPTAWTNFSNNPGYTQVYTQGGVVTTDEEGSDDGTNGGAAPQPCTVDLASEGDPGTEATEWYGYYNGGTPYDPDDPSTYQDDYLFFRMRIECDVRKSSTDPAGGFVGNHYNILLDVDGDGYKEFWVDLDGGVESNLADQVKILYEDLNRQDFSDILTAEVDQFYAQWNETQTYTHTRATAVDTQWWIDFQIPITAFKDTSGNQVIFPNTPIAFAYSTSTSNTNPLQKDWSRDFSGGDSGWGLTDPIVFGDPVVPNGEGFLHFTDSTLEPEIEFFTIGDNICIFLSDPGLNTDTGSAQTTTVVVTDQTTLDSETITLTETSDNSGVFTNCGSSPDTVTTSTTSGAADDGDLQTGAGNVVEVSYTDSDDGDVDPDNNTKHDTMIAVSNGSCFAQFTRSNGLDVPEYDVGDNIYVTITDINANDNPSTAETVSVTITNIITNPPATDSETITLTETGINTGIFRNTTALTMTAWNGVTTPTTNNAVMLSGDGDVLTVTYTDPGDSMDTCGDTVDVSDQSGNAGVVEFTNSTGTQNVDVIAAGSAIYISVSDTNANTNPASPDTIMVTITDSITGDSETITLTETGNDTGIFRNTTGLVTEYDLTPDTSGTLEVGDGSTLTATYTDANDGDAISGNNNKTDLAKAVAARVMIDNVIFDPCSTGAGYNRREMIGLYNPTDVDQTITGWRVSDGDAGFFYNIPQINGMDVALEPGGTAVIVLFDGIDEIGNYPGQPETAIFYAGSSFQGELDPDEDQISLYDSTTEAPANLIDFVAWDTNITHSADWSADDTYAVVADKWDDEDFHNFSSAPANCFAIQRSTLGLDLNQGSDFEVVNLNALAVDLVSFIGTPLKDAVLLEWETGSEIDNLGFNVYRSDNPFGDWVQVNSNLILGLLNSPHGANYYFVDPSVIPNQTYYYLLEDVETSGMTDFHGPVNATPLEEWPTLAESGFDPGNYYNGTFAGEGDNNEVSQEDPDEDLDSPSAVYVTKEYEDEGENLTSYLIEIRPSVPVITSIEMDDNTYSKVAIAGYPEDGETCKPSLPSRNFFFSVPLQEITFEVVSIESEGLALPVSEKVSPIPEYQTILNEEELPIGLKEIFCLDSETYSAVGPIPENRVLFQGTEIFSSNQMAHFKINPVRYFPQDNLLSYATRILIRLSFGNPLPQNIHQSNLSNDEEMQVLLASDPEALKLKNIEEGLIELTYDDLESAGFLVGSDPRKFQIYFKGREQAIVVRGEEDGIFDPSDSILYFAKENLESQSELENTYWLIPGEDFGLRMEGLDALPQGGNLVQNYFWEELTLEKNLTYLHTVLDGQDPWFAEIAISPAPPNSPEDYLIYTFDINHLNPTEENFLLTVHFYGFPFLTNDLDILINGEMVQSLNWLEDGRYEEALILPSNLLFEGENELRLIINAGAFFIDHFKLVYPRNFQSQNNYLAFETTLFGNYKISDFNNPAIEIFDVTDSEFPSYLSNIEILEQEEEGLYSARFLSPDHPLEGNLIASTFGNYSLPSQLLLNLPSDLHNPSNQGNYLILSPSEFHESLENLAAHRAGKGYKVKMIDTEDIYDEFGYGLLSPLAIKNFLTFAHQNWSIPPSHVLLVGGATYDFKGYKGEIEGNSNLLPVPIINTQYMLAASDAYYADTDGDEFPDLAIGRLPVENLEQLERIIERIINYENQPYSPWMKDMTLVYDNVDDEANDTIFLQTVEELLSILPPSLHSSLISPPNGASEAESEETRNAIIDAFNQGSLFIDYAGHGDPFRWADETIFGKNNNPEHPINTFSELTNQHTLPIVMAMSCLNSLHHFPGFPSLAEELLNSPTGGAIAVLSSTALTTPSHQQALKLAFFDNLLNSGANKTLEGSNFVALLAPDEVTLGQSLQNASQILMGNALPHAKDAVKTMSLLGDPGLQIQLPPENGLQSGGCAAIGAGGDPFFLLILFLPFLFVLILSKFNRRTQK